MLKFLTQKRLFILTTVFTCMVIFAVVFLLPRTSLAQTDSFGLNYAQNVGLSTEDIRTSAVRITRNILGVLGILALIIILYGGFVYMTSRGDMQKVDLAKKILLNATIGLVIIMMAFAIVSWIMSILSSGQGGSSGTVCSPGVCYSCSRCNADGTGFFPGADVSCGTASLDCSGGGLPSSYFSISDIQTSHGDILANHYPTDEDKSNVYYCSKIQTVFNHNINTSSVDAAHSNPAVITDTLKVVANLSPDEITLGDWATRGNVLSFTPMNHLFAQQTTDHSEHFPTSLDDTSGLYLSQCSLNASCEGSPPPDFFWNFYVGNEGDEINPSIISTYPTSDTTNAYYPDKNVPMDPTIQVNFSEAVDWFDISDNTGDHPNPSNIFVEQLDDTGNSVKTLDATMWDIKPQGNGFIMYLNNSNLLEEFTNYKITVQNIHDLCGNIMDPNPYIWEFATNNVVPGINSYYPQGNNVCPDTVISLTYNTSMYAQQITFSIQDSSGNPSVYTLEPIGGLISTNYNTGNGNIAGVFRVVDQDLNNINNNYRVYEFMPDNNLAENTNYIISYSTDKVINIDGDTLNWNWDFTVADMATCVCSPYISYLSKDQGPIGECLTINGQCFTGTQAQSATIDHIYFDTSDATVGTGYTANTVGTTVPDNFSVNSRPQISVSIIYDTGEAVPESNSKEFLVITGQATGPCLWSINPNYGQPGVTNVSLTGLRFGDFNDSTIHQVTFTANQNLNVSEANWSDTKIQNVIVPANTVDGDVTITNSEGTSNAMPFDARYCGDGVVDPGEACDGNNLNGQGCSDVGYLGGTLACKTNCQFDTTNCSNAPRVLENSNCLMSCSQDSNQSCHHDSDCGVANQCLIDQSPSPNPYKNSQDVCLNISIQADFNTDILASTLNNNNIYLANCGSDSTCSGPLVPVTANVSSITNRSFILSPNNYLESNTWYQATITTGIMSTDNVTMQENYVWRFKTKADSALCPLEKVHVTPDNVDNAPANTVYPYNASPTGPNCVVLQGSYNWLWSINQPDLGVSITGSGSDVSVLTDEEKGTTYVRAEAEGKYDTGRLNINFDSCSLNGGDAYCADPDDDGTIDCQGSICDISTDRCTPVINSLDPASGPTARWVTLNGCHFKSSRGSGNVYFGSTPVTNYPCNEVWQDQQIIVGVPISLSLGNTAVSVIDTYGLSSNNPNFNVITDCLSGIPTPNTGVPGICALSPSLGMPQTNVSIAGENFSTGGQQGDTVTFDNNEAEINNWDIQTINAVAPSSNASGDVPVVVSVGDCPSNSYLFNYATGAVGDPCDGDTATTECNAENHMCYPSLYCEDATCTCQPAPAGNVISHYPDPSTVCRNVAIKATFDQLMNHATLHTGNIQLWHTVISGNKPSKNCIFSGAVGGGGGGGGHHTGFLEKNEVIAKNKLVKFINLVKSWLTNIFSSTAQAQMQNVYWCPIDGYLAVQDVADEVENCNNTDGCTRFVFSPENLLDINEDYHLHIKGGANGAKTIDGGELATNTNNTVYFDNPSYSWGFTVGNQVCQIADVKVDVSFSVDSQTVTRHNATYDFYTCAGRDDCPDDIDGTNNGNQHDYLAQAYDGSDVPVPLTAAYNWTEYDTQNLIEIGPPTDTTQTTVTPNPYDGKSIIRVEALDPNPDDTIEYGSALTSISVTNFICENPWPSLETFPLEDSENNCTSGLEGASCHNMTFATYYCRDAGHDESFCLKGSNNGNTCLDNSDCPDGECVVATADDLPAPGIRSCSGNSSIICSSDTDCQPGNGSCQETNLIIIKGEQNGFCVGGVNHGSSCNSSQQCTDGLTDGISYCSNVLKEYMYNFNQNLCLASGTTCATDDDCPAGDSCQAINDSIGVRIYNNSEHLSPSAWYQKYANQPGSFSTKLYDGYEAIESGRTTYIGMAIDAGDLKNSPIYTDMFLMSYTDNYNPITLNIHDQLRENLIFNTTNNQGESVDDIRICSDSNIYCEQDSDCPEYTDMNGARIRFEECNANKTKLARDTIRMGHLSEMIYHLDLYRGYCSAHQNLACLVDTDCPDYYPDEPTSEFCIAKNTTYPLLEAGTYIPGESNSIWDSWNNNLASLLGTSPLLDPLNEVFCDYEAGYNEECWNQENVNNQSPDPPAFSCDNRAHFYHYNQNTDGISYNLKANMEYSQNGWSPNFIIGNFYPSSGVDECYNILYSR